MTASIRGPCAELKCCSALRLRLAEGRPDCGGRPRVVVHILPPMADRIARYVCDDNVALSLVSCAATASKIGHEQHGLVDGALRVLAQATATALLLGTRLKGQGLLTWQLSTDGLLSSMRVDAIGLGYARAMVSKDAAAETADWNGFCDALTGKGTLSVTKQLAGRDQPYQSIIDVSGSIASIANHYLEQSEQVTAVVGLDVQTEGGVVTQADGIVYIEAAWLRHGAVARKTYRRCLLPQRRPGSQ